MGLKNNLLEKIVLPAGDILFGSSYTASVNMLRKVSGFSDTELEALAARKMQQYLEFTTSQSPFYKAMGIADPAKGMNAFEWLRQFPVLDKPTLRQQQPQMLTRPAKGLVRMASSGSSGYQSVTYVDKHQLSLSRAMQTLWMEWGGYHIGNPILQTGITPNRPFEKKLKDIFFNTNYLNAYAHTREQAINALGWASGKKDPVLGGYASSLYVLACFALENGLQVTFKSAISWGDKLFSHYRNTIRKAFGCEVFETYGSTEGFTMAAQHDLPYMYLMSPFVHMEILDDKGNAVPDGEMGHVVVTNMHAKAMPMLRYKIGDLAIKLPRHLYPGDRKHGFPLLQQVVGRDTDLVKTASGKYMVVHSFTGIFEHLPQISQFCVVQDSLESITILYIAGDGFREDILDHIRHKIQTNLGEPFPVYFKATDYIAPTASGKPQLIISKLKQQSDSSA